MSLRVVVIGGSGHIGTYLIPRLVEAGADVVNVSRGERQPYQNHAAWRRVRHVPMNRVDEEATGSFGDRIAALDADVVIDLICFRTESCRQIVDVLRGRVSQFLHCGTIWVHGPSVEVPTTEEQPRRPFGEYGIRKAAIEAYLLKEARRNGFPAAILHPGHIVGPGWAPLNPLGHFGTEVFEDLAQGREVTLPNLGLETVHHVHADDVAQAFERAVSRWSHACGESFHVVSPAALTLRGYAEGMAAWFGREPNLRFEPWEEWKKNVSDKEAAFTWDHIAHSPNCSNRKAQTLLGYQPRYRSLQAVQEAVAWLRQGERVGV